MTSELRVDRIVPTTGVPTGGGGGIIQIVQSTKTDTASVTGGTFGDIGLSAAITPKSSSSKILVLVQANIGSTNGYSMMARLMRGSTPIHIGDAVGNRPQATVSPISTYSSTITHSAQTIDMMFLDSPSTTSATTYKVQYSTYSPYIIYINRNGTDQNTTQYDARTASSITLMEVSA